jgi:hypothetical protein
MTLVGVSWKTKEAILYDRGRRDSTVVGPRRAWIIWTLTSADITAFR